MWQTWSFQSDALPQWVVLLGEHATSWHDLSTWAEPVWLVKIATDMSIAAKMDTGTAICWASRGAELGYKQVHPLDFGGEFSIRLLLECNKTADRASPFYWGQPDHDHLQLCDEPLLGSWTQSMVNNVSTWPKPRSLKKGGRWNGLIGVDIAC
jgi:hypothetical protein